MRHIAAISSALIVTLLLQAPIAAADVDVSVRFSRNEITIIADFYRDRAGNGRGGGKHGKPLPPGIAKNLGRGKALPPGIAKQALPADLIAKLPPAADGYERVVVAGKVLLVEIATQVVHDVLEDLILR